MVDIHCHILPGIDDGAMSIGDSIAMAELAVKEGIHTIIATPHHRNGRYINGKEKIQKEVTALNQVLLEEKIPLTVLAGQENRIYGELLEDLLQGEVLPLNNTHYLFVEFPTNHVPRYAEKLFYQLQMNHVTPIIVHPERNQEIVNNPNILYKLVQKGALTQVTASSVAGYFGKKIQKFSFQLVEANLTHFLASDAHNVNNRAFKMLEGLDTIEARYGPDMVYYFTENAELLVDGKNVMKEVPEKVKTKKFLGIL